MDLSITIVNTNHINDTLKCLESIYNNTHNISYEIFIVNNACSDNSEQIISRNFPEARLMNNKQLEGVAANFNKGFKRSTGRYLLMLNEDCVITDDCLDKMVGFLDDNTDIGVASPQILNLDGSIQPQGRKIPTLFTESLRMLKNKAPFLTTRSPDLYPEHLQRRTFEPEWVGGTAMFFRKEALGETGLFDESFFIFWEDVDICKRIKKAGWRVIYYNGAKVVHKKWVTTGAARAPVVLQKKFQYYTIDSKFKYFRKYYGKMGVLMLKCINIVDILMRLIKLSLLYFISPRSKTLFLLLLRQLKLVIVI